MALVWPGQQLDQLRLWTCDVLIEWTYIRDSRTEILLHMGAMKLNSAARRHMLMPLACSCV